MVRARRVAAGIVLVLLASGCTPGDPAPASAPSASVSVPESPRAFAPGAAGIGDPYFPAYGNGGYDVAGYDLKLRYDPKSGQLRGSATITATATQDLSSFHLDLAHLTVSKVTVEARPATSRAQGAELIVTPAAGLPQGTAFTTVIEYGGKPAPLENKALGVGGWLRTADGGFALGQPESASTWFPVNDHPADKAKFSLAIEVPDGVEAISNGVPGPRSSKGGWTTWTWSEGAPMASYLATVVIGQFRVTTGTHDGKPSVVAIPESLPAKGAAARSLARTGEIADFLAGYFGPYPFDAYGGVVLDDKRVGYALETQSRPVYGNTFFTRGVDYPVVVHELAHQWYGDSVALKRWEDIWLNEGFATYAEWLWSEHERGPTAQQTFDRLYARWSWANPTGDPGADRIFGPAVYQRGAMVVHALRKKIGDKAFFGLLKSWPTAHRDGNVTTDEFIAAAEQASGKDLGDFFQAWLYGKTKPQLSSG